MDAIGPFRSVASASMAPPLNGDGKESAVLSAKNETKNQILLIFLFAFGKLLLFIIFYTSESPWRIEYLFSHNLCGFMNSIMWT